MPSGEVAFEAGADFAASQPAHPGYPKGDALSAYAAFPWVYSCVDAISSDLAGLPLMAVRGTGADAERLDSHPVLDLLAQPSTRVSAQLFRKQLVTDYILTGDAYALIAGEREPVALLRMIPQRVTVKPWADGQPGQYLYDSSGKTREYTFEEVLHLRSPSWEDDPSNLYGTGAVRPLDHDLRTELASIKSAEQTAKTGRPSGIISPSEPDAVWGKEQISRIRKGYERQMSGQSGLLILGGPAKFDSLQMTPRDLEFSQQREMTRSATLAVFSVPPTRVGLPTANYATAREQAKVYWQTLQSRAAFIDVELTRLAQMFPGSESVRVVHDFSAVEALQESRSDRVLRVRQWYDMGLSLADAAAFEGFEELPEQEFADELDSMDGQPEPEADEAEAENLRSIMGIETKAVGDKDPTNFPEEGDDEEVSLSASQWGVFDPDYAEDLKLNHPNIWRAGGNIKGSEQFKKLYPIAKRGGDMSPEGVAEERAIRLRESWGARHLEDFKLAGVVAQIKWLVVGSRGQSYMKDLIEAEKKKGKPEERSAFRSFYDDDEDEDKRREYIIPQTREERVEVWKGYIERLHEPAERKINILMRGFFTKQSKRYASRLRRFYNQKGITKAPPTEQELTQILASEKEKAALRQLVLPIFSSLLEQSYQLAIRQMDAGDRVFDPIRLDGAIAAATGQMVTDVSETTERAIRKIIIEGLAEGQTTAQVQRRLMDSKAFDAARALMIARTEATRNTNAGALAAFASAADEGVPVQVMWITAGDSGVRDAHRELDGVFVPEGEAFSSSGGSPVGPGQFGSASEDINCRCNLIPFIDKEDAEALSSEREPFRLPEGDADRIDTFFPEDADG